ncbi:TolC family protein [Pontibacter beigongshangensis]|uniref:TolC family protein n=1 Tax=Pontibacter beigongshangensis TaxID=2574733 RepID=UPI0018884597|nr:TolC family protein [Pontibacter beigongshangensis]
MPKRILLLLGLLLCGATAGHAQSQSGKTDPWSLQEAIDYAVKNNLQGQQNRLNRDLTAVDLKQSKLGRLPSINANGNFNSNAGSFQDPVTFTLITQRAQTSNFQVGASVPLFMGFQQVNQIKQNAFDLQASEQEMLSVQNDISIQVVTSYLNILFADELIKTTDFQRNLTQQQLDRTNILFRAGSVAENAVLDLQSQLATDELNFINAQNQLDIARLQLMQLLNLPTSENFEIVVPDIPEPDQNPMLVNGEQVYDMALQTLPAIKAADLRVLSAAKGIDIARGGYYPRLSLSGGISSRYSSSSRFLTGRELINNGLIPESLGFFDEAGTQPVIVYRPDISVNPVYGDYSYFEQMKDNIARQVGLSLSVPIFNGLQVRNNVERARIGEQNARLNADIARNNLRQTIEQAYVDAVASQRRYRAAKEQVLAAEKNFRNAEMRLNSGVINTLDFNVITTTYRSAQSSLLQAKYEYTFKLKVLDFYQGKPLAL